MIIPTLTYIHLAMDYRKESLSSNVPRCGQFWYNRMIVVGLWTAMNWNWIRSPSWSISQVLSIGQLMLAFVFARELSKPICFLFTEFFFFVCRKLRSSSPRDLPPSVGRLRPTGRLFKGIFFEIVVTCYRFFRRQEPADGVAQLHRHRVHVQRRRIPVGARLPHGVRVRPQGLPLPQGPHEGHHVENLSGEPFMSCFRCPRSLWHMYFQLRLTPFEYRKTPFYMCWVLTWHLRTF